jgi:hypothetical protein
LASTSRGYLGSEEEIILKIIFLYIFQAQIRCLCVDLTELAGGSSLARLSELVD